jgi:hypothetical protein
MRWIDLQPVESHYRDAIALAEQAVPHGRRPEPEPHEE